MEMEWKASQRYTSPFPPLEIRRADAAELEALAHVFVAESIRNYERFLLEKHCRVDETQWRFMYEQESVRSYAERRKSGSGRSNSTAASDQSGPSDNVPMHADTPAPDLPIVLVTGSIEGDLDDTVYGYVCPTLDMMRIKAAYIKEGVYRACVLASLVAPTAEDPFRSLTIKWIERRNPLHIRAVMKNRDYVYMDSTGVEYLRNGERVGYQLVHSVQFSETPVHASAIRGNMSMCAIYRDKGPGVTEVFLKGFLNPAGGIVRSIITRSAAQALVSVAKNVHCVNLKKLVWAVRHQRHRVLSKDIKTEGHALSSGDEAEGAQEQQQRVSLSINEPCSSCDKLPSRITRLRALATGKSTAKRRRCKLCRRPVCAGCRVEHKLSFLLEDRRLVQLPCAFCVQCVDRVLGIKAVEVARDKTAIQDELYRW